MSANPITSFNELLQTETGQWLAIVDNTPSGETKKITINNLINTWYEETNANGNNLIGVAIFESNAANVGSSGPIRLGNDEDISWRNAANNNNGRYTFDGSDRFEWVINSATKARLSATEFDILGQNIIGVNYLESDATNPAATGVIRLGNTEIIAWRNAANTDNIVMDVNASNTWRIAINGTVELFVTPTLLSCGGNTIVNVNDIDMGDSDLDNVRKIIYELSTTTTAIDFGTDDLTEISISANTTFTGIGYEIGSTKVVKITTDGTLRTLTFPSGWVFIGTKPTDQAASKIGILSLTSFTAAEAGVVASYAVEA